jgi:hypothetical protein
MMFVFALSTAWQLLSNCSSVAGCILAPCLLLPAAAAARATTQQPFVSAFISKLQSVRP